MLHSICQQIWKTQQWPQDWKRSVFNPIPKKGNAKECSNYCTIALISHTTKEILKILRAKLQQYVNHGLPDVQAGFRKGRGTRDQIANIYCIVVEKAVAPHSGTLAWKIPWTEQPGGLQSRGSLRVGHNWSDLAAAAATGSSRKQESSRKTSTSVLLIMSKLLTVWITTNCGQLFKRWEYQTTHLPPEKSVYRSGSNS